MVHVVLSTSHARRSRGFVVAAVTALIRVFDLDALRDRMVAIDDQASDAADSVEKALESNLCQEIDGYLLVSRDGAGWDAMLALLLALDRDHRALLERVLDRAARIHAPLLDDLEALSTVLTDAESLAEDVEAEREDRRAALGFVEPRAARAFLALARGPFAPERDPLTRAHLRAASGARFVRHPPHRDVAPESPLALSSGGDPPSSRASAARKPRRGPPIVAALRALSEQAPSVFDQRAEELAYLANVLVSGAEGIDRDRVTPGEAAEMALATVALGAILTANGSSSQRGLRAALEQPADVLFRRASSALAAVGRSPAYLRGWSELASARRTLGRFAEDVRRADERAPTGSGIDRRASRR